MGSLTLMVFDHHRQSIPHPVFFICLMWEQLWCIKIRQSFRVGNRASRLSSDWIMLRLLFLFGQHLSNRSRVQYQLSLLSDGSLYITGTAKRYRLPFPVQPLVAAAYVRNPLFVLIPNFESKIWVLNLFNHNNFAPFLLLKYRIITNIKILLPFLMHVSDN